MVTDTASTQIISDEVTLTVRGKVPTGDNNNLPLYLVAAMVALLLLILLRRRAKRAYPRIDDGVITKDNLLCKNTVAANNLSPQKAAVLLRLALTGDASRERLKALFSVY